MRHYSLSRIDSYDARVISESTGLTVIHAGFGLPLGMLMEKLKVHNPVVFINARNKKPEAIKTEITAQYGKPETVVLDGYELMPEPAYFEYAAENINGAFICINRRNRN